MLTSGKQEFETQVHPEALFYIKRQIKDLKKELNRPVCFETAAVPIFKCDDDHLICSSCIVLLKKQECPQCRAYYPMSGARRLRGAERQAQLLKERQAEKLEKLEKERALK